MRVKFITRSAKENIWKSFFSATGTLAGILPWNIEKNLSLGKRIINNFFPENDLSFDGLDVADPTRDQIWWSWCFMLPKLICFSIAALFSTGTPHRRQEELFFHFPAVYNSRRIMLWSKEFFKKISKPFRKKVECQSIFICILTKRRTWLKGRYIETQINRPSTCISTVDFVQLTICR